MRCRDGDFEMKAQVFPEAFLRAMSAEDRRQMTMAEAQERYERGERRSSKLT
jgi:hypothetical protein